MSRRNTFRPDIGLILPDIVRCLAFISRPKPLTGAFVGLACLKIYAVDF